MISSKIENIGLKRHMDNVHGSQKGGTSSARTKALSRMMRKGDKNKMVGREMKLEKSHDEELGK